MQSDVPNMINKSQAVNPKLISIQLNGTKKMTKLVNQERMFWKSFTSYRSGARIMRAPDVNITITNRAARYFMVVLV